MLADQKDYVKGLNIYALSILGGLGYEPVYEDGYEPVYENGKECDFNKSRICGIAGLKGDDGKLYYRTAYKTFIPYISEKYGHSDIYKGKYGEKITIVSNGELDIEFRRGLKVEVYDYNDSSSSFINIIYKDTNGEKTALWLQLGTRGEDNYYGISLYDAENSNDILKMYFDKSSNQDLKKFNVFCHNSDSVDAYSYEDCSLDMLIDLIKNAVKDYMRGLYNSEDFEAGLEVVEPALIGFIASFKKQWAEYLQEYANRDGVNPEDAAEFRKVSKNLLKDAEKKYIKLKNKKED